ncbi:restriction endonuclease subunit S [Lacticaseibacillus paracasei]|nr:restriction endonuclease subunit S [Lacticaseibacillus paracasei]MDM7533174.1 restriction endonuclease subunit S [Lacticaseibacillus paracasei]
MIASILWVLAYQRCGVAAEFDCLYSEVFLTRNAWEKRKLTELSKNKIGGGTPSTKVLDFWNGKLPWLQSSDINESNNYSVKPQKFISLQALKHSAAKRVPANSIAVVTRVGVGKLALIEYDYSTSQDFLSFSSLNWSALFSVNLLTLIMTQMSRESQGTSIKGVTKSELLAKKVRIPISLKEQEKLGILMKSINDLIAATQHKIDAFEQIKKALLQHLFDQSWRFKEYSELWTPHLLGEITSKVTEKNTENLYHETFTNSAKYGIVEQQSFFDKSISNEANLANYYVVRENDFVYNPRISNSAPVGPVRRNKLNRTGVMSPLYYVFRATTAVYPIFLEYFFKGESWYRFMYLNGDTGARSDRFAIKDKVFEQMPVKLPEKSEQEKIGALLQNLETVINQTQERLQKIRDIKDSLLKSLFV